MLNFVLIEGSFRFTNLLFNFAFQRAPGLDVALFSAFGFQNFFLGFFIPMRFSMDDLTKKIRLLVVKEMIGRQQTD